MDKQLENKDKYLQEEVSKLESEITHLKSKVGSYSVKNKTFRISFISLVLILGLRHPETCQPKSS